MEHILRQYMWWQDGDTTAEEESVFQYDLYAQAYDTSVVYKQWRIPDRQEELRHTARALRVWEQKLELNLWAISY